VNARALIVAGSRTDEDRYGVQSAERVTAALSSRGWQAEMLHASDGKAIVRRLMDDAPDVVVPVGFGPPCEDGHIHAVARILGVPCAGPTPAAGSLMQDKASLSRFVRAAFGASRGIRPPRGCEITVGLPVTEIKRRIAQVPVPLVLKPSWSGSSEGLHVVQTHEEAVAWISDQLGREGKLLVQMLEEPLHEVSCTVVDTRDGPWFLPVVELLRGEAPVMGIAEKFGDEALGRHRVSPPLRGQLAEKLQTAVLELHEAVGSKGLTRTDILILPGDELVILEMNGIPGLLESSIACDAARAAGLSFADLCVLYAESAFLQRPEPDVWGFRDRSVKSPADLKREYVADA